MEVLESLFARALNLESPWEITKIRFPDPLRENSAL